MTHLVVQYVPPTFPNIKKLVSLKAMNQCYIRNKTFRSGHNFREMGGPVAPDRSTWPNSNLGKLN